jgi:hypothetical protein
MRGLTRCTRLRCRPCGWLLMPRAL